MPIHVRLEQIQVAEHTQNYDLVVQDDNGKEMKIHIAQIKHGGLSLVNYEVSQRGKQEILSAFFYINVAGHDLDQWLHFDLKTGEQILDYVNPRQVAGKRPEHDRIESEADKRQVARKLRLIVDKWGKENDKGGDKPS